MHLMICDKCYGYTLKVRFQESRVTTALFARGIDFLSHHCFPKFHRKCASLAPRRLAAHILRDFLPTTNSRVSASP